MEAMETMEVVIWVMIGGVLANVVNIYVSWRKCKKSISENERKINEASNNCHAD